MTPEYLVANSGPSYFTILGVDPGSTTMGIAALRVNIADLAITDASLTTIHALQLDSGRATNDWMLETHSARSMRLRELAWMLGQHLVIERPLFVVSEAPFFNPRNPNAYQVLVETMKVIENAVYAWNPWRPLYRIETTVAKKAVMPSDSNLLAQFKAIKDNKEKVSFSVKHHSELSRLVNFDLHDEHAIDALIVAYTQLVRLRNNDFTITF